jgi:hypothetical protein
MKERQDFKPVQNRSFIGINQFVLITGASSGHLQSR